MFVLQVSILICKFKRSSSLTRDQSVGNVPSPSHFVSHGDCSTEYVLNQVRFSKQMLLYLSLVMNLFLIIPFPLYTLSNFLFTPLLPSNESFSHKLLNIPYSVCPHSTLIISQNPSVCPFFCTSTYHCAEFNTQMPYLLM